MKTQSDQEIQDLHDELFVLDEQREDGERFGDVCRVSELKMKVATLGA